MRRKQKRSNETQIGGGPHLIRCHNSQHCQTVNKRSISEFKKRKQQFEPNGQPQ